MTTEVKPPPAPPSAVRLALSGAVGLALGLALVAWSMGTERPVADPDDLGDRSASASALGDRDSALGDRESDSDSDSDSESGSDSESESDSESDSELGTPDSELGSPDSELGTRDSDSDTNAASPSVAASTAAGTPGSTTFERGRVAFLRCGEPEVRCGRDRDFEEAAWAILAELPSCQALAGRVGTADIRIRRSASGSELRFRDWGDTPIPTGALRGCLESTGLADLPISVEGSPLIVSFRFRLR